MTSRLMSGSVQFDLSIWGEVSCRKDAATKNSGHPVEKHPRASCHQMSPYAFSGGLGSRGHDTSRGTTHARSFDRAKGSRGVV